jgi:hypothetical protein
MLLEFTVCKNSPALTEEGELVHSSAMSGKVVADNYMAFIQKVKASI